MQNIHSSSSKTKNNSDIPNQRQAKNNLTAKSTTASVGTIYKERKFDIKNEKFKPGMVKGLIEKYGGSKDTAVGQSDKLKELSHLKKAVTSVPLREKSSEIIPNEETTSSEIVPHNLTGIKELIKKARCVLSQMNIKNNIKNVDSSSSESNEGRPKRPDEPAKRPDESELTKTMRVVLDKKKDLAIDLDSAISGLSHGNAVKRVKFYIGLNQSSDA